VEWYEHSCPRHGVIVTYSRDELDRPAIPNTCPRDGYGSVPRCGERVHLRIAPHETLRRSLKGRTPDRDA
jgi:hypothetical protein